MINYMSDKEAHKDGIIFLIHNFEVIVQEVFAELNITTNINIH